MISSHSPEKTSITISFRNHNLTIIAGKERGTGLPNARLGHIASGYSGDGAARWMAAIFNRWRTSIKAEPQLEKQKFCAKNHCGDRSGHYIGLARFCQFSSFCWRTCLMKITNWCKKLSAAIVAAGILGSQRGPCHQHSAWGIRALRTT